MTILAFGNTGQLGMERANLGDIMCLTRESFNAAGVTSIVTDIASRDYPTSAARHGHSHLDSDSLVKTFGIARPQWRAGIDDILTDLRCSE